VSRPAAINIDEKLYTVAELCDKLQLERHTVSKLFAREAGVVLLGTVETVRRKRKYQQLRVPQSVLTRVLARRMVR
jgi:methylphosphotriester-DNA--protein-cysteine methyltransferase